LTRLIPERPHLQRSTVDSEVFFVDDARQLARAVEAILREPVVGLDSEFVGEASYEPRLCLLQVSTRDEIFVIDPLARIDLAGFWQALTEPDREVVAFAARQELLFCLRYAGRLPGLTFDPQLAAGLVGFGYPLSHTNLLLRALDVRVDGGETYTDWRRRPLSARQLAYAADDVRHLLPLSEALLERAAALGRAHWLRNECERFVERVLAAEGEERWWRVSGASGLNRRRLGVLRELWRWRDRAARQADQPPRRIMSDDLMVEVAKRSPQTVPELTSLRGMDRPAFRTAAPALVAAVQAGLNVPDTELPELRRPDDPPQVAVLAQLLAILANNLAAQHKVDPGLLATAAELQEFVRWRLGFSDVVPAALLQGWRGEVLGGALVELLEGKRVIRVADPRSASPLSIEPVSQA
jgi:ribonuclease D